MFDKTGTLTKGEPVVNRIIANEKYQFTEVRLSVFAGNERAVNLYQQHGFSEYSQELRTDVNNEEKVLLHMSLAKPSIG